MTSVFNLERATRSHAPAAPHFALYLYCIAQHRVHYNAYTTQRAQRSAARSPRPMQCRRACGCPIPFPIPFTHTTRHLARAQWPRASECSLVFAATQCSRADSGAHSRSRKCTNNGHRTQLACARVRPAPTCPPRRADTGITAKFGLSQTLCTALHSYTSIM